MPHLLLIWTENSTSAIYIHVIDDVRDFLAANSEIKTLWVLLTWVLRGLQTCSFDSWGSCRTPNCGSPSSCLHVHTAWLRDLASSVRGRVIVSVVGRVCKISWCAASSSGHAAIFIKLVWGSFEKIGPQKLLSCNLYTCAHQVVPAPSCHLNKMQANVNLFKS